VTGTVAQPSTATRAALADLVEAVAQLAGLTGQVGPFALPADTADRAPEVVAAVCAALDVPLSFDAPGAGRDADHAAVALAAEIRRAQRTPALAGVAAGTAAAAARAFREREEAAYRVRALPRPDGTVLTAVEAGSAGAPCVVIVPPAGVDHRLALPWLRALSPTHRCVLLRVRGTDERIEDPADFDRRGHDVDRQVEDVLARVGEIDGPVHLMALCAGAAVTLAAAARRPDRIGSVSLWHADLELGDEADKTDHQTNLRALLDLGGESRDTAAWLRGKLTGGPMTGVPEGIGPLVVRPYATAELFYRYARLTAATMHCDSRAAARRVACPCLVVTSDDDATAHPAGSRRLAELLPDARLVSAAHGDHLDAFRAGPEQVARLRSFLGT
jgi:3-oxoadipate enol-lactonase